MKKGSRNRMEWSAPLASSLLAVGLGGAAAGDVPVNIVNQRSHAIHVSFTLLDHTAGPIQWNRSGSGCLDTGATATAAYAKIAAGTTCEASVSDSAGSSRFCAAGEQAPADCMNGQQAHLTLVETNFQPFAKGVSCDFGGNTEKSCVWYDISVIPANCTDALWSKDQCKGTGGASYNLPVSLSCLDDAWQPTYTCGGPPNTDWGPENYPSRCGNPDPTCSTGAAGCADGTMAYFHPMWQQPYEPNAVCPKERTLAIEFLAGS